MIKLRLRDYNYSNKCFIISTGNSSYYYVIKGKNEFSINMDDFYSTFLSDKYNKYDAEKFIIDNHEIIPIDYIIFENI